MIKEKTLTLAGVKGAQSVGPTARPGTRLFALYTEQAMD